MQILLAFFLLLTFATLYYTVAHTIYLAYQRCIFTIYINLFLLCTFLLTI